jgi:Tol biopolymer transport system component
MQQPILLNLKSKEVVKLQNEVRQAGQISFSQNGKIAFTIGNSLVVINGEMKEVFELGTYSNLAPISPDGSMIVFNDFNDQLKIITLSTKEVSTITDGNGGYFNPIWSPDGLNILFSSLGGTLKIFNIVSKQIITVGDGFSPSWSANSGMIVYYKTEIVDFDLKNTDLYVYDITSAAIIK